MSLDGLFVGNNGIVAGICSLLLCCSIMTGDCASNCLLILLDNEVTTLYPFLQQDGTCRLSGCCAVQIPTTMTLGGDEITIGNVPDSKSAETGVDFVCHFVRAFEGALSSEEIEELRLLCPSVVQCDREGMIGFRLPSMNNQVVSPLILIQVFLKYAIQHEEARIGGAIRSVFLVYPPSFSSVHVHHLRHIFRCVGDYSFTTQNRVLCQICSFLPLAVLSPASPTRVLVFDACYDALHIYLCELSPSKVRVSSHVWSTSLGRHCIVVRFMNSIVQRFNHSMQRPLPETTIGDVYDCCNSVLDCLAVQSSCSLSVRSDGSVFKQVVRQQDIWGLLTEACDLLKKDLEVLLAEVGWTLSSIPQALLTGTCYSLSCYETLIHTLVPAAALARNNDVNEMVLNAFSSTLTLEVAEPADSALYKVLHSSSQPVALSSEVLQLMRDEVRQLRGKRKKQEEAATPQGPELQEEMPAPIPVVLDTTQDEIFAPTNPDVRCMCGWRY